MSRPAFALVAVLIAQPVFAQSSPAPRDTTRFGALRRAPSNPFGALDPGWLEKTARELPSRSESPKRSLVCGLTILSGDAKTDPKFFVTKKNDNVNYTLRTVDPPVCKP